MNTWSTLLLSSQVFEIFAIYLIIATGQKPFFYKSLETSGTSQTGEEIAKQVLKIIEEIGVEKCVSVVTDNAANMRVMIKLTKYY